jgi:Xaa-Pro aminopeptidase
MRPLSPSVVLQGTGLPALLVAEPKNVRYLTGVEASSAALLLTPRSAHLYLDPRYFEAGEATVRPGYAVEPVDQLWTDLKRFQRVGFESEHVTVARLQRWKKRCPGAKWVRTRGLVEELRRQKDDDELARLRRAERITKELLRRVPAVLRKGLTEKELAWKLAVWARDLGADGLSFDPIVAFGSHTSRMHHHPTTRALKKGHIVQVDVGAVYRGYCADLSEIFFTADPTPAQAKACDAVTLALEAAIARMRPGARTAAVDEAARKVLRRAGMEDAFGHALGHGIGLDAHEGPVLAPGKSQRLLPGEVLAVEPGVYFPGQFGIRRERMVFLPAEDAGE